jgi:hypothetical protein
MAESSTVRSDLAPQHVAERGPLVGTLRECDLTQDRDFVSEWKSLIGATPGPEPFYQPEWFRAFSRAFVPEVKPLVLTVRSGAGLLGVAPLMRARSFFGQVPARTLRSLSGIHSCRYDIVCDELNRESVASEMWRALRDDSSWDVLEFEDVPIVSTVSSLVERAANDGFPVGAWSTRRSPYMTLGSAAGDPFADCPVEKGPNAF